MKQYTENQYDDDLTLGNDEYDDSYYTDADDLFEFSTDDESPISRLKSLVLSIDWEITDEVLLQFNEELLDLKSIWAGETIYLVYVQALEKISKYIYQNKADSHPNAIKLLLTFYYNLEKIVSSLDLSEEQKKEILLEDVKRFENLKRQIKQKSSAEITPTTEKPQPQKEVRVAVASADDELLNLKAIVLGIDWEIGDQELNDLRSEVSRLEEKYSGSRPKLILLQGIGTLAAYIKVKKSNAHPDAFIVMQLFYESLEKIVQQSMGFEEEKAVLFPAVERFNSFKALIGTTISNAPVKERDDDDDEEEDYSPASNAGELSPALSDVSEEEEVGFQAEDEAMALGLDESGGVTSHIDSFFEESGLIPSIPDNVAEKAALSKLSPEETDKAEEEISRFEAEPTLLERGGQQENESMLTQEVIVDAAETVFPADDANIGEIEQEKNFVDREKALQGVDVETEADDDSDELSLPMEGEELAPALVSMEEESLFSANTLDQGPSSGNVTEEIVGTIDGLFASEEKAPPVPAFTNIEEDESVAASDAVKEDEEEPIGFENWLEEESKEEAPVLEVGFAPEPQDGDSEATPTADVDFMLEAEEEEVEKLLAEENLVEDQLEDNLSAFFSDSDDGEGNADDSEVDALFESLEADSLEEPEDEVTVEILTEDEASIYSEKEREESVEDELALEIPEEGDEESIEESVSALFADTEFVEGEVALDNELAFAADAAAQEVVLPDSVGETAPVAMEHTDDLKEENLDDFFADSVLEESIKDGADQYHEEPAEEEVVFELFKEEAQPDIAVAPGGIDEGELAAADRAWMENDESLISDFSESAESKIVEEWADEHMSIDKEQAALEPLGDLQACIHSLKIEINDTIIAGMFQEIDILRQKWADKPLERIFLQLLSTIAQHIDSYRYESSAEAYALLVSVSQAMSNLKEGDIPNNQELLFVENVKVLEWQQGMLSRQAIKKDGQLSFSEPIRTEKTADEQPDAQKDFNELLEHLEEPTVEDISYGEEYLGETEYDTDSVPASTEDVAGSNDPLSGVYSDAARVSLAEDLRKEIAALRQTLKNEIAELRMEFKKD